MTVSIVENLWPLKHSRLRITFSLVESTAESASQIGQFNLPLLQYQPVFSMFNVSCARNHSELLIPNSHSEYIPAIHYFMDQIGLEHSLGGDEANVELILVDECFEVLGHAFCLASASGTKEKAHH